jgi:hypothetical protein
MVNTFEGLLALLVASNVAFILVGVVAVCLNGFVRTTEDLDVLIEDSRPNIERLLQCLRQFGQGHASQLTTDDFTDEEGAIRVSGGRMSRQPANLGTGGASLDSLRPAPGEDDPGQGVRP